MKINGKKTMIIINSEKLSEKYLIEMKIFFLNLKKNTPDATIVNQNTQINIAKLL